MRAGVVMRCGEGVSGAIPADLVTASGAGLDPDPSNAIIVVNELGIGYRLNDGV